MIRSFAARAALSATAVLLLAGPALAQSSAPIPSMPMPPSMSDPAPKETGKAKAQPRKAQKRTSESDGLAVPESPARGRKANAAASAGDGYQRPQRYVPEEFDRGSPNEPRAKPIMTDGGRPGVGMKF